MNRIELKPLSVNEAYTGRRFSTPEKKAFADAVAWLLPKMQVPSGPLHIDYRFGVSNMGADVDGPIKVIQDCLSRAYGFNDNVVTRITAEKVRAGKGAEFFEFNIKPYTI